MTFSQLNIKNSSGTTNLQISANGNIVTQKKIGSINDYVQITGNEINSYIGGNEILSVTSSGIDVTGTITGSLTGNVTGDVTGDVSGSSGTCNGNSATATALASSVTIGGVSFNGSSNINLPGVNATGDQDTSGAAAKVGVTLDTSTIGNFFPLFVDNTNGNRASKVDTGFKYNPGAGTLTADTFDGALSGNADTATTATNAENIAITANNSTNETVYPVFVDGSTGNQGGEIDTGLTYNPSTGILTSTAFAGSLTGNVTGDVTGDVSGSSGSCTGNAATATKIASITNTNIVQLTGSQTLTDKTLNNPTLDGTITISGDLVPDSHETHDLGSSDNAFKDVHLGGHTIYLGGMKIEKDTSADSIKILDASDNLIPFHTKELMIENRIRLSKNSSTHKLEFHDMSTGSAVVSKVDHNHLADDIPNTKLEHSTISGKALGTNLSNLDLYYGLEWYSGSNYNGSSDSTLNVKLKSSGGLIADSNGLSVGTLNQNTTGSAASLTTSRNINGVGFNGSTDIKIPGTIVYMKQLDRSLGIITLTTSFKEIHTDLRMKYIATQTNITCHFTITRLRADSGNTIYYQIYDWYNNTHHGSYSQYFFHSSTNNNVSSVHIVHTIHNLTVGNTYYFTLRFKKLNSYAAYIYPSYLYGVPSLYLTEHITSSSNSGTGFGRNAGDSESSGGGGGA